MSAERVGALFWIVFGAAAIYGAVDLGLGTMEAPGSGFLTFVAASFVTLMAVLVLIQSYRHDAAAQVRVADLWRDLKWGRTIAILLLTIVFIFSFETVGFFVCSFVLLVVIMRWLEGVDWKTSHLPPLPDHPQDLAPRGHPGLLIHGRNIWPWQTTC